MITRFATEPPNVFDAPMSCGCVDYHMADCPLVTGNASDYDAPEPDEYSNLDYAACNHSDNAVSDGTFAVESDGSVILVCDWCEFVQTTIDAETANWVKENS